LIRQISGGTAQKILELLDFDHFITKLLDIVSQTIRLANGEDIITNSLDLLIPLIIYRPTLIAVLKTREGVETLFTEGLLHNEIEVIRQAFEVTINTIC
jgi:hypothetical protein